MEQFDIDWGNVPSNKVEGFQQFHRDNPHVYTNLVNLTREGIAQGRERIGMKMLFEVLRWNTPLNTSGEDFKLNNNYTAFYARMIEARNPDCRGIFGMRRALADF